MNEAMNTILTGRSARKSLDKPIPDEDLQQVIQAALYASSGMGKQTWQFTVVRSREKIQKLASVTRTVPNREGYDVCQPEVLVIPSDDEESPFGREDNACTMENIFPAAHSMGIGFVWINQLQGICGDPAVRQVLSSLGIPQGHMVYRMAALGYADDERTEKGQIDGVVIVE